MLTARPMPLLLFAAELGSAADPTGSALFFSAGFSSAPS